MSGFKRSAPSKLPIMLAASVGVFGVLTIAIALASMKKTSVPAQAEVEKRTIIIEKPAPIEMVDVLVPAVEIEQGKKLDPVMFKLEKRPKIAVGNTAIKSFEELKNQYARSIIPAGNPLNREVMTPIRPANPVIASIPSGFRAVSISVNALSSVEGWATAGAMVDVQWINDHSGKRAGVIIVQNAKILSAERQVESQQGQAGGAPVPTTVTLLVTDHDAQKIALASTSGNLMLLLRGAADNGKAGEGDGPMTLQDLSGASLDDRDGLQGVLKIKNADGTYKEIGIKNGRIQELKSRK